MNFGYGYSDCPNKESRNIVRQALGIVALLIISVFLGSLLTGCIKTTRVVTSQKDGKEVREETTSWEPVALPVAVYHEPVEYVDEPYYSPTVVRYPVVVSESYYVRSHHVYCEPRHAVYIDHRPRHYRRW